ncbi:hypothetical protein EBH_0084690 [Eimeria brunetti]|uniref:Uncharacterized protein n=1 Tax=Eimeria brunetti TaxID=51314 RepID=U6LVP0_9EIME|nr:hypothetical protein EBH_0084690 [Eimeria brunetti]
MGICVSGSGFLDLQCMEEREFVSRLPWSFVAYTRETRCGHATWAFLTKPAIAGDSKKSVLSSGMAYAGRTIRRLPTGEYGVFGGDLAHVHIVSARQNLMRATIPFDWGREGQAAVNGMAEANGGTHFGK